MNSNELEITEMNAGNNNLSNDQQQGIEANNFTNFVDIERNDLGITKPQQQQQQQQQNEFNKQQIEVTPSPAIQVQVHEQAKANENEKTKPFIIQNQAQEAMDISIVGSDNHMMEQQIDAADLQAQNEPIQIEVPEVSEPTTKKIKLAENEKQEQSPHLLEANNVKQGTSEIKSSALLEAKNDETVDDKPPVLTDESRKTTARKEPPSSPLTTRKISPRNQGNLKIDSICKELKQKKDAAAITKEKPKVELEATPAQIIETPKGEKSTTEVPEEASTAAKVEKKVQSSDDEIRKNLLAGSTKEFRHELELMKGELEKSEPDSKKIVQGIQATFKERQLKFSSDKITISETYLVCPALRRYDAIITECELVKDKPGHWAKFATDIERMVLSDAEKELQKVKSQLAEKRVHISSGLERWNNVKKDGSDSEKLKFKKDFGLLCCLSRKCRKFWELNFFRERKSDEQLVIDIMSPFIDVEGQLFHDNTKFTLYVEGVKVMETSTLFDATLVAYCLYWTFNLEYRPEIKGLFTSFDSHF